MIIATVNSKGGVGKTTIAVHLADWFFLHGWKVCLVDCDAQRLSSRWLNEARNEIAAYVMDSPIQINESLPTLGKEFEVVVVDAPGGLGQATGAISDSRTRGYPPNRLQQPRHHGARLDNINNPRGPRTEKRITTNRHHAHAV